MSLVVLQQPSTYSSSLTHSRSYSDSTNYKSRSLKKMDNKLRLNNSVLSSTSDSKLQANSNSTSTTSANTSIEKPGKMISTTNVPATISRKRSFEDDSLSFASKRSKTEPSTPRNYSGDLLTSNSNGYVKSSLQLPSCQELLNSALNSPSVTSSAANPVPLTPPSLQKETTHNLTHSRSRRQQQQQSQQTSQNNSGMNTPVPSDEEDNCSLNLLSA
ncbi:unnamed protein product [[Candida] boidinii]|nr:unnamed protein product [[Candida] boidinii]